MCVLHPENDKKRFLNGGAGARAPARVRGPVDRGGAVAAVEPMTTKKAVSASPNPHTGPPPATESVRFHVVPPSAVAYTTELVPAVSPGMCEHATMYRGFVACAPAQYS